MCLSTIEEKFEMPENFGLGYKVFWLDDGKLRSPAWCSGQEVQPEGKWLRDLDYGLLEASTQTNPFAYETYKTGFHLFLDKDDALNLAIEYTNHSEHRFVVRRVRYKNIVAIGQNKIELYNESSQMGTCIVARDLFIEKGDIV